MNDLDTMYDDQGIVEAALSIARTVRDDVRQGAGFARQSSPESVLPSPRWQRAWTIPLRRQNLNHLAITLHTHLTTTIWTA
jgi:hypothetical protein